MPNIRVRFAPSPTGSLHLGSLRTSLYNFMMARSAENGSGRFILRIEDTDQQRLIPGAIEKLNNDLKWLGLTPDEGPLEGGPFGPYIQSHRISLYRKYVEQLVAKGAAYRCFCSEKTLELMRKEALRRREVPRYDNRCRNLTPSDVKNRIASGCCHVIRFKLRDFQESWHDLIYGDIFHNVAAVEGDPIIFKRDGYPTYHLANVVDDNDMQISHVLRGAEWQTSTPKHLQLFEAFGWKSPKYAHLPLLLNSDGTKLSKRQNDTSVEKLREAGLFPEALHCFTLQMGGHFANSVEDCLNLPKLANSAFRIERIGSQFARVDFDRLYDLNREALRLKFGNHFQEVVYDVQKLITSHYGSLSSFESSSVKPEFLSHVLKSYFSHRLKTLNDLLRDEYTFVWLNKLNTSKPFSKSTEIAKHKDVVVSLVLSAFETSDFGLLSKQLKKFAKENHISFASLMLELRLAITDQPVGIPVGEAVQILGYSRAKQRLERYWS